MEYLGHPETLKPPKCNTQACLWSGRVPRTAVLCARRYSLEADVWSFGILLEELALGRAPMANMSLTSVIMSTLVRAHCASPMLASLRDLLTATGSSLCSC